MQTASRNDLRVSASERIYRARRIGLTFGRVYLGIKTQQFIARRIRPPDMRRRWSRFNRSSAQTIYETAIDLRGLILKGCQYLGSRADLLPREYVEVLARLQDRVPPKPFRVVRGIIERELGHPLEEVFESFSPDPIAAASLAQVHAARLINGQRVAVKVQYPEIAALVRGDLANLRALFRAVGYIERDFDLMPLIDELGRIVPRELDFVNEGRNAEAIAAKLAHRPELRVPKIIWEHTTPRVLVMEFMEGIKITDAEGMRAAGMNTQDVAKMLIEIFAEQILTHGFFHADPHPGNILVQPEGPRLVLLDFGLAKDLPDGFRQNVVSFVLSLVRGDAKAMAHHLTELGFETRDGREESLEALAKLMLDVAQKLRDQPYASPRLANQAGERISEMVRENPIVRIPSHLVLVGRVMGLLSGVSHSLGSRVNLLETLFPYAMGTQPPPRKAN